MSSSKITNYTKLAEISPSVESLRSQRVVELDAAKAAAIAADEGHKDLLRAMVATQVERPAEPEPVVAPIAQPESMPGTQDQIAMARRAAEFARDHAPDTDESTKLAPHPETIPAEVLPEHEALRAQIDAIFDAEDQPKVNV